jgi:hypothetical protein
MDSNGLRQRLPPQHTPSPDLLDKEDDKKNQPPPVSTLNDQLDVLVPLLLLFLSTLTRYWSLGRLNHVVWDEVPPLFSM